MTAQGGDVLAWLDNSIAVREQVARLAHKNAEGRWHSGADPDDRYADEFEFESTHVVDDQGRTVVYNEVHPSKAQSVHIALNDPASVLLRCAADRKSMELYEATVAIHGDGSKELAVMSWVIHNIAEGYGWTGGKR